MRQRRLLALLLLQAGRVVTVDTLVDELWEDPPPSARPQVHNAVRDLRRSLPTGVTTTEAGYRLAVPRDAVDLHRFTARLRSAHDAQRAHRPGDAVAHLEAALRLWRGEPFPGVDCPAVESATVRLTEQRLTAVDDLVGLRLASEPASGLVAELRSLVAEHPLRESFRGCLMTALHRSGRQAEALAVYEEGRRLLDDEFGLEPGPALRALQVEVLRDAPVVTLQRSTARDVGPAATRPGATARNDLPRDLADFTGRATEVASLLAAEASPRPSGGSPFLALVDGMGGVGKTTLAVHVAHLLAQHYPDGCFFLSLCGFQPGKDPLTAAQALAALLRADGAEPDALPGAPEELGARWRARLAGRRCLIVLDDVADRAQVEQLLPGDAGSAVLMTSRHRPAAPDGSLGLWLDVMTPADAAALFVGIVGAERVAGQAAHVAAAVERCGYLPVAVRMSATRLRDRPSWSVADLAARLATPEGRASCLRGAERDVMSLLCVSYERLGTDYRRFGESLGRELGTSTFDVARAAAVGGLPLDTTERFLDILLDNNLVRQDARGAFDVHLLVCDSAGADRDLLAAVA